MSLTSSRYGVIYPNPDRSDVADVPYFIGQVVTGLEQSAIYGQGPLSSRPPSSAGTPGKQGRFYMQTDVTPHVLYYDFGQGWDNVGSVVTGSIGTAQLADGAVTNIKLADGSVTAVKIANGTITALQIADNTITVAKLVDGLVPSRGAGGSTEALRALGTGAGQAVSGSDSRLSDQRVPLDNSVSTQKLQDLSVTNAKLAGGIDAAKITGLQTALTYQKVALAADISMAAAGTVYDAVTLTLGAGTWLIDGFIAVYSATATSVVARLWDGTTVYKTGSTEVGINTSEDTIPVSDILVLGGTATIRLAASTDHSGVASIKAKDLGNVGTITYMNAVKIA